MERSKAFASSDGGSTLVEVLVATLIMIVSVVGIAHLFALSVNNNLSAKSNTFATMLAEQKLEQLRALTWGFDIDGLPVSDYTTDTAVSPESPTGGTGLRPSPPAALQENTPGYVDHLTADGRIVGRDREPPPDAVYTRRWSIEPLPTNPNNTIIIQVLVTRNRNRGQGDLGNVARLPDEARVVTVKTRKAS